MSRLRRVVIGAAILVLTLLFFERLAFSDLILARGDTFAYFYPYWHVRNAALLDGRLPLWSPDLFMGVPLLANSQLGTLYPPNWPLAPLAAPDAVRVSLLLHIAWALAGCYLLARQAAHLNSLPALLAAALFTFGGHVGAHVEQINQLQGLAWMPWVFLLFWRAATGGVRRIMLLAVALALQVLAGHTQAVFITLIGLVCVVFMRLPPPVDASPASWWGRVRPLLILAAAGFAALILASPQLVPTWELADVSNRRGGLTPNQATAFSFSPLVAGRGLLPSYDETIFGEYVAYVGVVGLGLAVIGILAPRPARAGRRVWLVVMLVGLLLAFGMYNPLYWTLAGLPGFNLFRVPARWLALLALGAAMLAGLGAQHLLEAPERLRRRDLMVAASVIVVLAVLAHLAERAPESVPLPVLTRATVLGWGVGLAALLLPLGVVYAACRRGSVALARRAAVVVSVLALLELFAASRTLPYNDAAAPDVYSGPRFTGTQLQALHQDETPPGRFLSISALYFDPGDKPVLEDRYQQLGLDDDVIHHALVGAKMKEVLAPNLPLVYGLPSIDGFDGGLLPTAYYTAFSSLLLPPGTLRSVDGRLRELLATGGVSIGTPPACRGACLPPQRWLDLSDTRYLITDKVYDLWYEGIAYDTQFELATFEADNWQNFEADAVDVLLVCPGAAEATCAPSAFEIDGRVHAIPPAFQTPVDDAWLLRYPLDTPMTPRRVRVEAAEESLVRAVTLVDTRVDLFQQLTPQTWRRVLSSDIKLYENQSAHRRAFVVHQAQVVDDSEAGTEAGLTLMGEGAFDPAKTAILSLAPGQAAPALALPVGNMSAAAISEYTPERIVVQVDAAADGLLVLTDAFYPGWRAVVNGVETPLLRANIMFRAVAVPSGVHEVVFEYRPTWLPGVFVVGAVSWLVAGLLMFPWKRVVLIEEK